METTMEPIFLSRSQLCRGIWDVSHSFIQMFTIFRVHPIKQLTLGDDIEKTFGDARKTYFLAERHHLPF